MTSFKSKVSKRNCDGEIPNLCDSLWAACYWKTLRTKKKITKKTTTTTKKNKSHRFDVYISSALKISNSHKILFTLTWAANVWKPLASAWNDGSEESTISTFRARWVCMYAHWNTARRHWTYTPSPIIGIFIHIQYMKRNRDEGKKNRTREKERQKKKQLSWINGKEYSSLYI